MESYLNQIKQIISHVPKNKFKHYLIAFSGGRDSLYLLMNLLKILPATNIVVLHVNHGLRGKESQADEDFVLSVAKKYLVKIEINRVQTSTLLQKGNIENNARMYRYAWFQEMSIKYNGLLCLGHNLNDQIETVMMKIYRGTGMSGMSGMPVLGKIFNLYALRPLLLIDRKQITKELVADELTWREDPSNQDEVFFRNNLRKNLIPLFSLKLRSLIKSIQIKTRLLFNSLDHPKGRFICHGIEFEIDSIIRLSNFEQRKLIEYVYQLFAIQGTPNKLHTERLKVFYSSNSMSIELNKGINVFKNKSLVYFEYLSHDSSLISFGDFDLGWDFIKNVAKALNNKKFDPFEFNWPISELNKLVLAELDIKKNHTVFNKILNQLKKKKVPHWRRRKIPVVEYNGEVVFIPYLGIMGNYQSALKKMDDELVLVTLKEIW